MATYTITYDKTTPESAEHGDFSERGYYMPGGWEYEVPAGLAGEAFGAWVESNGFEMDLDTEDDDDTEEDRQATAILCLLREYGCDEFSGSDWWTQVDSDTDYGTGEETRKSVHVHGVLPGVIDRVNDRLKRG